MSARVAVRLSAEADTGDATGALVRRAQRGDGAAFEALYRQHAGRVYALCLRMSGDAQHAAELTHDVFVHVWRKLNSFRGDARFTTWLQRVAVNFVLNAQKSDRRRLARVEPVEDPRGWTAARRTGPSRSGSTSSARSRCCRRARARSSCCTMSRVGGTATSRSAWARPRARSRRSCTVRGGCCASG
jgi:RNA polymerase sigma factor (sigma-70 family)